MDHSGKLPVRAQNDWDDRGRRGSHQSLDSSTLLERQEVSDTAVRRSRSRRSSLTSGHTSRHTPGGISLQRGTQPDTRLEERRGLAHRLHVFPFRPHSSNASRSSSTNTSSSSLLSLADHAGLEPATDYSSPYFGTSPSQHSSTPRAPETSNPPLSPLSEYPILSHRAGHSVNDLPVYPDQSYAVLQSQVHPTRIQPHLRSRSSYPSPYPLSSSGPSWPTRDAGSRGQGSRTAGNTPISSPGLFSSRTSPSSPPKTAEGRTSFSYLHPTHLQEPKETHTVEVDRDMLTGNKLINEYEILDELGRGEHGKVKLGRHLRTGKKVAIKIVQRYSKRRRLGKLGNPEDKVKKEVAILKKARHENVVSLLEVIDDPNQQKVYIVLEFVENGEIVWRKKGLRDIVVMDKYRLDHERQGSPESPFFMEEIQRQYQLKRQKDISRMKRRSTAPQFSGVSAWSLEHGGVSDDEMDTEDPPYVQDSSETHELTSKPLTSANELDSRLRDTVMAAVEGSMYGAYAAEPHLERRLSTVSSHFTSHSSEPEHLSEDEEMSYVPCLTLSEARRAFRDSVLGLEYLHYQGIIHRDIKPANLLVTGNRRVKISDFGVSYLGRPIRGDDEERVTETDATELDDARELSKTVGTPAFYAPELCYTGTEFETVIGHVPKITGAIDVWSLGVTLYGMIFGRLPFVAEDEYKLYNIIVTNEVFIPRKRLKAVEVDPSSSQASTPQLVMNSNKRTDDELAYEDIDDELCDLLRRLLTKDPSKRITLKEIKHHPWVLRDIPDKERWIETTDPSYQSKGKRIEVSKEEVTKAVTKMPFIERVRSNVAKWGSIFGRSKDGRRRAPSSANSDSMLSSSSSSSITLGKDNIRDFRKRSLRGDEELSRSIIRSTRDCEHPLSHSVLASPVSTESHDFSRRGSNASSASFLRDYIQDPGPRPDLPDRASSTFSSSGSTKTIRPLTTDMGPRQPRTTTPNSETLATSSISGIFGGAGRRLAKGLQNRERRRERSPSSDRASTDGDGHSGPVVAVSTASATGLFQSPDLTRGPSSASLASSASHDSPTGVNRSSHRRSRSHQQSHDASAESFHVARETLLRQRMQHQDQSHHTQGGASLGKDSTVRGGSLPIRGTLSSLDTEWHRIGSDQGQSFKYPIGEPITSPPSALTMSSSSADELNSGMSHSASHPSIPSVISGASSLSADGFYTYKAEREKELDGAGQVPPLLRTGDTVTARKTRSDKPHDDECRYDCDDENEDDDDESEDEGIVFGKRSSCPVDRSKRMI
ncbi:CAMKK/ELM protein kinase [[Emmonsia] crescens]|uniref:non-specific serine/threonine protein kinase n=1 Tax=[Emmonsia] crescens TaxID=73230 RepID=A0A2B7ZEA4_9EURO|nr:CAMKK/ELM protein kinase [Emmonsia crescens]